MMLPVDGAAIAQHGARAWLAPRSDGHRLHAGVDLATRPATIIRAPESGVVFTLIRASRPRPGERQWSAPTGWAGYGEGAVLLRGDSGYWHLLAHVSPEHVVREGERVTEGQMVAQGSPSLGHVHWEVRVVHPIPSRAATVEATVDPRTWLDGAPVLWSGQAPPEPVADRRTPRQHRPGWRGPPPPPFPLPTPRPRGVV